MAPPRTAKLTKSAKTGSTATPTTGKPKKAKKAGAPLQAYRDKRDFARTPEPSPAEGASGGRRFVIQKHAARRLHCDLRLELDGVLKSWAVTRGPSLVPGEKRLAVHTEDHPLAYLDFEGVIPEGEYGAGTMIVWDQGDWAPVHDAHKGLAKGHLEFTLQGQRLAGRWHLVRMRSRPHESREQWLLIKGEDAFARAPAEGDVLESATSVLSGLSNDDLVRDGTIRADHARRQAKAADATTVEAPGRSLDRSAQGRARRGNSGQAKPGKTGAGSRPAVAPTLALPAGAKKGLLPVFVPPSLATLTATPPTGAEWIHEIKYDGYRIQARLDGGTVALRTRKGLDWTARFPSIAKALAALPVGSALLDGEIVSEDEAGVPSFPNLQADLRDGRTDRLAYYAFDLLYAEGRDLTNVPQIARKDALEAMLAAAPAHGPLRYSTHFDHDGPTMLAHACRLGLEGIVSKRRDAPVLADRGAHWFKAKCVAQQEFVILGFTRSTAAKGAIGSLVLGYREGAGFVACGRAGTGFSSDEARFLSERLSAQAVDRPALSTKPTAAAAKGVVWVEPTLVAEIAFRGWTQDGLLRQAAYKGLREDKPAEEVVREEVPMGLEAIGGAPLNDAAAAILAEVKLTHPDRVLWEGQGITKRGLAEFYATIADWVLPHLVHRPLSLVRCPAGAGQHCFYQKHVWEGLSEAIKPVEVGDSSPMTAIEDLRGLLGLVQAGVLEIHPWGSRIGDLERPDRLIFDLDPGEEVAWDAVIAGARDVRERLRAVKLESFVKTTGGKGLHVVVPLTPSADWDTAKAFCKGIAEAMAKDSPGRYVAQMAKALRKGRIFVDYLRNGRGATAVAAYSTRARPGAAVSTPLAWDELSGAITADHFRVDNLPQRLAHLAADPWAEMPTVTQVLPGTGRGPRAASRKQAGRRR